MIIDVHDHFTTAPAALREYRQRMLKEDHPKPFDTGVISDDDIRDAVGPR